MKTLRALGKEAAAVLVALLVIGLLGQCSQAGAHRPAMPVMERAPR